MDNIKVTSKYISLISIYLFEFQKNEPISHSELSSGLGISKTNLSNIIKRLEETDFLNIELEGRNKYYYLSDNGIDIYNSIKNQQNKTYYKRAKFYLERIKNNKNK